jgi:uncharacterized protein (DUF362 family)
MSKVYIEHGDTKYPSHIYGYAPSENYPEYRWSDISKEKNEVYDMVRNCLVGYGLDKENFGTPQWNPLGDIVKKGDTVVVKPNWVEDKNENRSGGIECLVTNASVIRAMIDYVHLALQGTGKIIVGDSPMPDCDFNHLMKVAHYETVFTSCKKRDIPIEVMDFRDDIVTGFANKVEETGDKKEVVVDLEGYSCFSDTEFNIGKYRNGIVDATEMNQYYHTEGHHRYGINHTVLSADVIINLPKPKTHRKAGFTAALKNYIGICATKISIPHNVMGNEKEGGDTYHGPKIIFETEQRIRDEQNRQQKAGHNLTGTFLKVVRTPFWLFRRATHKKYFGTGNWYKNDTIWRSILDINRIMIYADAEGNLHSTPQRKFFSLGDMIISGHKNGPLAPTPKDVGILICSENPVSFDLAVINLMGFDFDRLPVLNKIKEISDYPLPWTDPEKIEVLSNEKVFNHKSIVNMPIATYGYFKPAEGWDVISRKGK